MTGRMETAAAIKKVASLCVACILTYNIVTSVRCLPQLYRGFLMSVADSLTDVFVWFKPNYRHKMV